jgi:hypothetical protein
MKQKNIIKSLALDKALFFIAIIGGVISAQTASGQNFGTDQPGAGQT